MRREKQISPGDVSFGQTADALNSEIQFETSTRNLAVQGLEFSHRRQSPWKLRIEPPRCKTSDRGLQPHRSSAPVLRLCSHG
jgi:hypothetical protein